MAMPLTEPWTVEQLDRLPDDGNRYEVLDGELFVTPATRVRALWTHPYITMFRQSPSFPALRSPTHCDLRRL
jgi:hypothetical protein